MMDSTPQYIVVCSADGPSSLTPAVSCGALEGVPYSGQIAQGHVLTTEQYQAFLDLSAPFNATEAGQFFAYGFGVVVGCWVVAYVVGLVLHAVKEFGH